VNERNENRHFQRPHSFHVPFPGNPREYLHICRFDRSLADIVRSTNLLTYLKLILPETTFPGLHFCRWQYMGSSANFRTVLSENRRCQPISCRARNRF